MKTLLSFAVAFAVTIPVAADERDRIKAQAALAIADAFNQTRPRDAAPPTPGPRAADNKDFFSSWRLAAAESRRSGRPIFTSVNTDCSTLCGHLAAEYVILHTREYKSDGVTPLDRPRLLLTIPASDAERQWCLGRWDTLPTLAEVRAAERAMKATIPLSETIPLRAGEMRVRDVPRVIENGALLWPPRYTPGPIPVAPAYQPNVIQTPIFFADTPKYPSVIQRAPVQYMPIAQTVTCGPNG